jgi:hypothetical protein
MTIAAIDNVLLPHVWPHAWPLLEPALLASSEEEKPDVRSLVLSGRAQLWLIVEDKRDLVAAVVTEVTTVPEKRCRLWLVGGNRLREWAADFMAAIEPWARSLGCTAIWGTQNRRGWARIVKALGGEQIEMDGMPIWARRI